ncbi:MULTISPECIES: aminomethyl-transferring glycine dehydrogenase subunit GcvPA [Acidiplasma]|uniref:Glycine dehydrogenase n=2 Tax=Acidiplasma TaxID=507753 RepID=A0A0Q0RK22_9ARCH|nr:MULTISPECIES: aminomethyl-transferring glycine dehydrogenase subunit GcvPA [Acidiplasma]KJE49268.1 glycine dehydrogenase [Acidiplasma sp. MBA-1]KQB35767.1 glycine dehydrogenase [Acidiplasma cupricumulans]WMT54758.1 MAG: aminomethyl-transferring glycine dehydrogenase subunit GcvPA [Acidiplasma sp.]
MEDLDSMLNALGIKSIDELFLDIPEDLKVNMKLGEPLSEYDLINKIKKIGDKNKRNHLMFLGNGIYDRYIPHLVDEIISRNEFLTSYTPYQPEISQGMLTALFEYQSIISDLTEMDVTNSSMYDGYTALGEAVRMAYRINGKNEILIPENIYKSKLSILNNYSYGLNIKYVKYGFDRDTGLVDLNDIQSKVNENTCAIITENPNSYGLIDENVLSINEVKKNSLIISYYDPISLGIIKPPGEYGADIAVAEGQQLGIHMNAGGPLLGLFSFKREYVHKSPGRLIGEGVDKNGRRAFVMTLQAREQHIRRARAMSNICSNQALMAVAATAYLSILGSSGLRKIASITVNKAERLKSALKSHGIQTVFNGINFSDVLFHYGNYKKIAENGISGGLRLSDLTNIDYYDDAVFFSVTEKTEDESINELARILGDD